MFTGKDAFTVCLAVVAGFVGGQVSQRQHSTTAAATGNVVRGGRFELVDKAGRVMASWGPGENKSIALRFLDGSGTVLVDLGTRPDSLPYLYLNAADKGNRLAIQLVGVGALPRIVLSDRKWEGRAILGNFPSDTPPFSSDDWGLQFRAPQGMTHFASIGMVRSSITGNVGGRFQLVDEHGKHWGIPSNDKP